MYPPSVQPAFASIQTVNQVCVGLLYRITGSPKVLANGLQPLPLVKRVKVIPPSVEVDAAEKLLLAAHRESLKAHNYLVGVVRVGRSVCLRLNNVRRGLGPRDQVNIRGTIRERDWQQFLDKPDQGIAR